MEESRWIQYTSVATRLCEHITVFNVYSSYAHLLLWHPITVSGSIAWPGARTCGPWKPKRWAVSHGPFGPAMVNYFARWPGLQLHDELLGRLSLPVQTTFFRACGYVNSELLELSRGVGCKLVRVVSDRRWCRAALHELTHLVKICHWWWPSVSDFWSGGGWDAH